MLLPYAAYNATVQRTAPGNVFTCGFSPWLAAIAG
jgi:hypothetical protein